MIDSKDHKIINFTKIEMFFLEVLVKKVGPHISDVLKLRMSTVTKIIVRFTICYFLKRFITLLDDL